MCPAGSAPPARPVTSGTRSSTAPSLADHPGRCMPTGGTRQSKCATLASWVCGDLPWDHRARAFVRRPRPSRPRRGAGPGSLSALGGGRNAAGTHMPDLVLCGHHVGLAEVERHVREPPQSRTAQRQAADGLIRAGRPGVDLTAGLADAVGADPFTGCRDRCGRRTSHGRKGPRFAGEYTLT